MPLMTDNGTVIRCPLSGSDDVSQVSTLAVADLISLYGNFGVRGLESEFGNVTSLHLLRAKESDLIFFHPMVTGSDAYYRELARLPWYYEEDKYEFRYAARHLSPSDRVLEIGCGHGHFAARIECAAYTGLEFSSDAVAGARARGLNVFRQTVEEHARDHAGQYDAVCSFQVLEHVAEVASFISACVTLVRPGGKIVFGVPAADSFMAYNLNDVLNLPPHHVTWWTDRCLAWLATRWPVKLIELHHQTLSDGGHRRYFLENFVNRAMLKYLGQPPSSPIILTPAYLRMQPVAKLLAEILGDGFESPVMEPRGHTVIATYVRDPALPR